MLGLPETARALSERLLPLALGRGARRTRASSAARRCPRAFAPRAWRPASSRRASTWACSSRTPPATVSAARFTTNARVGAPVIVSRQADLGGLRAVVANSGCSNVGDGQRGLDTARGDAGRRGRASSGWSRRRWAWPRPGVIGMELPREPRAGRRARPPATRWAPTRRRSPRRSSRATAAPSAPASRWTLSAWRGAAGRPGQGRGDDLAALRHDVLLRRRPTPRSSADTLDLLTGVCVKRSFDRISVDGQLSTSDTVFAIASGALRRAGGAGERRTSCALGEALDALLRQLGAARSWPTARARGAWGESSCAGGPTPWSRWPARSPTRRSSRRRCTAATPTSAAFSRPRARPGRPASRSWPTSRSRAGRWCRPASVVETPAPRCELVQRRRGGVRAHDAGRGRRDRGLLLRLSARSTSTFNSAYTS